MTENRISRIEAKQIMNNPNSFNIISKPGYTSDNFPSLSETKSIESKELQTKRINASKRTHTDINQQPFMKKGKILTPSQNRESLETGKKTR